MKSAIFAAAFVLITVPSVCLAQAVPPAAGGGGGAGRGGAAMALNLGFYTGEFDTMNQVLMLTDDQKPKLQDKINAMNQELDQFVQGAQPQVAAARRGARGAARGNPGAGPGAGGNPAAGAAGARGNRAGVAGILAGSPVILGLQDQLQELANEHQVLINQILTPEQRLTWETYKLTRVLDPRLQPLGLTDDQKDKVKSLVDDTAKSLAELTDGKAITELQGKLYRKLVSDVLTDAQAGKLMEGVLPVQQPGGGRGGAGGAGAGPGAGGGALPAGAPPVGVNPPIAQ